MTKKVVDPHYAKNREYSRVINKIADQKHCPFCPKNFHYHKYPALERYSFWFLTKSSWPYKKTRLHLLLISERHKESLAEMNVGDWLAIDYLVKWAIKKFRIKGGGFACRFGQTEYTGATVCHLHAHLVVPSLKRQEKRAWTVNFPIG